MVSRNQKGHKVESISPLAAYADALEGGLNYKNNIFEVNRSKYNIQDQEVMGLTIEMLEVTCNDRLGKKVRVKCNPDDTIGDLKRLIAAQTGTRWDKIVLKKWYTVFKDHITLEDSGHFSSQAESESSPETLPPHESKMNIHISLEKERNAFKR